jgi:dGTPase
MIKHETAYDKSDASDYEPEKRASLEAQIANLADEIAYNAHDLDDGLRANLFTPYDLEELEIWRQLKKVVGWSNGHNFASLVRHEIVRELIGMSVTDVMETTAANLAAYEIDTPEKVQVHPANIIDYSADLGEKIRELKRFLYERMYRHYRLMRMQAKAERFISELFEAYVKEPLMLPESTQKLLESVPVQRLVTDYIAGMTDRYALDEWQKLFDPYRRV